jgi:hypothetical protein
MRQQSVKNLNAMLVAINESSDSMSDYSLKLSAAARGKSFKRKTPVTSQEKAKRGTAMKQVWANASYKERLRATQRAAMNKPGVQQRRGPAISAGKRASTKFDERTKKAYAALLEKIRAVERIVGKDLLYVGKLAKREGLNPHYIRRFMCSRNLEDLQ